jgi:glycosyltransferase involved in cell wall biosynthesis
MTHDCVYATAGWGIHDERWVTALLEVGLTPHVVSLGRDAADAAELRRAVEEAAHGGRPVLAGPLDTVTRHLADLPLRLVGLSWGYDLSDLDDAGEDLGWLARLGGLIVDSHANREIAERAGLDASRITFLPWGVDLATFVFHGPWIDAYLIDVPPHAPLVLSLRAHEPLYRVGDIVEAFARVPRPHGLHEDAPDPYLVIGHSGSLTDDLRRQAAGLGIASRVRFLGSIPEQDLVPLLGRAACYVTASRVDGTSVTLLQAMACGTPVIASDTPGNLGWIEDGVTGFTFPTGDIDALARVMQHVIHDHPTDVALRARARVEDDADWHANLSRLRAAMDRAGSA